MAHKTRPVDVIVTADTRGNYIEHMVQRCGGHALRVPDGYQAFAALKKIVLDTYEKEHSLAVALDGPLGPRHEPKKLVVPICPSMRTRNLSGSASRIRPASG